LGKAKKTVGIADTVALCAVLKATRGDRTQREVAEKTGWPQSTIAEIEKGQRRLSLPEFRYYCRVGLESDDSIVYGRFSTWNEPATAWLRRHPPPEPGASTTEPAPKKRAR